MIDIHTHILPGLDDGAESLDESMAMAEIAVSGGTKALAASVHANQLGRFENFESPFLKQRYRALVDAVKAEKLPLTIVRGMEIFASGDMIEKIRNGELISLNGSGNYLVEFMFPEYPGIMEDTLYAMLQAGIQPVLAHPERYFCVQEDPNLLVRWRNKGVLVQMNKGSIFGRFGRREAATAELMLKHRMINCIASDAHGSEVRTPDLSEIGHYLERYYSAEDRHLLLEVNPSRILMGQPLPKVEAPIPVERKRWF